MDMREWTQNNMCIKPGTHFPLAAKLCNHPRRSRFREAQRTPGTEEYRQKQEHKSGGSSGSHSIPRDSLRTSGNETRHRDPKKVSFKHDDRFRMGPNKTATPHTHPDGITTSAVCAICRERHTTHECPNKKENLTWAKHESRETRKSRNRDGESYMYSDDGWSSGWWGSKPWFGTTHM